MAINIKFDIFGNPEPPTIILANRNGNKLGQLKVNEKSIELTDRLNDASEISFTINKYIKNELSPLWDNVVDFKLIYCKEWDAWFEIKVELDEETETVKTVFCTQLAHAELSQIMLYNVEINTEKDIERDDYKISILYDENNPEASILNRILEKAPHYSIAHVDPVIAGIQRSFSFDKMSIHDAFRKISEEIGCLFVYNSNSEDGIIKRTISVYDLWHGCLDCGYRHESEGQFINDGNIYLIDESGNMLTDEAEINLLYKMSIECPKCGGKNIKYGYGKDTLIFVTSDELASNGIQLTTDTDSVKNCFKLEAGDDLMTATVRNCNPNGTDFIWYLSDFIKEDMSDKLVDKIDSYNELYRQQYEDSVSSVNNNLLIDYNALVDKYSVYNENLQKIETPIVGYPNLMNAYYNTIDMALYLKSVLMPSVKISDTNAKEQAGLLTASSLSSVAVADIKIVSLATANSAVLSMAKVIVKSTFKVEVKSSELVTSGSKKYWRGNFIVTNYSDDEDVAESSQISVELNDDLETVTKQKIDKLLNKENTDDLSITGLFGKSYNDFCAELKKYALNPLTSFRDACQACIDILIDQGIADKNTWSDNESGSDGNLYENLYLPYYKKLKAIDAEIKVREKEINIVIGTYDADGKLISKGLQTDIESCRSKIQTILDFENYLGDKLWLEFCCYRREDTYSNENYISDGLNNAELFKKAQEFFEVAEKEIYKSSELQHSISTTLNNLLAIKKFKPLVNSFKNGNWIRVKVDDQIYKLRLIEYTIDFGKFDNISVEFSDVTKIKNGTTDVQSILSQASSMATSYDSIKRQSEQGDKAQNAINKWLTSGLNSALVRIQNNDSEDITLTRNGLLCRSYNDIEETYSPEQFKLTHNIMAYTTDNWETVSSALGKHDYVYYGSNKTLQKNVGYGLSAKFINAGYVNGSQIIGGEIYSQNYTPEVSGTYINLNDGTFSWAGGKIEYDGTNLELNGVGLVWKDIKDSQTAVDGIIESKGYQTAEQVDGIVEGKGYQTSAQVTQITKDTVTTSYVNALKVTAGSVAAENISGTTISGKTISGGKLSGVTGEIGGWTIGTNKIYAGDSKTGVCVMQKPMESTTHVFAAGGTSHDNYSDSPFRVTKNGILYATKAVISGDSTFGGKLNAVSGTFTSLSAGESSFKNNQVKIDASYTDDSGTHKTKGSVLIGYSGGYVDSNGILWDDVTIRPSGNLIGNIGTPAYYWDRLCVEGVLQPSDKNIKKDISVMGEKQEEFFNLLTPVTYKFIHGTSDRHHYGFISQDVENAIIESDLTAKDFAGFCKDVKRDENGLPILDENGNQMYVYSLKYTEFIALNTHMIQKLQLENQKLKERIDSLEHRLESIK